MKSGSAAKYPTLSLEQIKNIPIKEIAAKNSVVYLWATVPLLPEAFEVLKAWKYQYKTSIFWRKIMSLGMGFWYRGQVEVLLLGIKGNVKAFRIQEPNIIQAKVLRHSEKPIEFRQLIERSITKMPDQNKIELFAREKFPGWDSWGNEIDSDIDFVI